MNLTQPYYITYAWHVSLETLRFLSTVLMNLHAIANFRSAP